MNAETLNLQSLAQLSTERMLNCAVEGFGIALLAWIVLRVIVWQNRGRQNSGRQNSGTRFAVWFVALLGIAALPLLGHFGSGGAEPASEVTLPAAWALYIFAGWALVAAAGLARIGVGFWHLHRLRKSCVPIDVTGLDPLLKKTLAEFDSPRPVAVCVSEHLRVPTAIGFFNPRVVIPAWTMRELSAAELNPILLHELAHLRRWDDWTNLVQKIVGALLFFHPAVWWIDKRLALEREMACDDMVVARTASPRAYAECLVALAEKTLLRRGVALAQAAVSRIRHVSLRVAQILDVNRPGATRVWKPAPALLMGISLACLVAFSGAPRLISFKNASLESFVEKASAGSVAAVPAAPTLSHSGGTSPGSGRDAQVIPAKFVVKPAAKSSPYAAAKTENRKSVVIPIPAKATQRRINPPMLIRSGLDDATAPGTLIVILQTQIITSPLKPKSGLSGPRQAQYMQSGQDDPPGSVVWNLCVWRITVIGPARNRMEQEIIVKSI